MASQQRKHVSNLVPANTRLLTVLLLGVAIVNSATLGWDSSVMNGLAMLPSYTEYFRLNTATTGLNNAAIWMGGILGCLISQQMCDYLGRKRTIFVSCIVGFVGVILQGAAQHIAMFVVARLILGIGSQLSSAAAPTLLAELLPAKTRGRILGFFFSCFYVGSLLCAIINYGSQRIASTWSWRLPSILQCIPCVLALVLLPFVPESPRWLISQGQHEWAKEVLMILNGEQDLDSLKVQEEHELIERAIAQEAELTPGNPWKELIATPGNRKRLYILISFGLMIQQLGNFVVSFYLGQILTQAGITSTETQTQINVVLSCWGFVVALAGSWALDYIGRRKQTLGSIMGMIITLYMLGGLIKTYGTSQNTSGIYASVAVIFLFQGCYAFAITPMTSLYPTEICPFKIRAAGFALFRLLDCAMGLMSSFTMGYAMQNLGWRFYLINASYNFLFLAAVYFLWPETKGQTLEDIALHFEPAQRVYGSEPVLAGLDIEDKVAGVKSSIKGVSADSMA